MYLLKNKSITFLVSLLLLIACAGISDEQPQKKMNVLFIAVDDLKPILGCYGDAKVITPNIDKLASEGTLFANNHCQQAVCGPSRASLLTGLRPDRTQVWDLKTLIRDKDSNALTMPQYFKQNGYTTAATGKIFDLRSVDKKHDEVSWSIPYESPNMPRWIGTKEKVITQNIDLPDENFIDVNIVNRSITLMETMAKKDAPFFLAVGFKKPHLPFVAPRKNWEQYDRDKFELAEFREFAENAPEFAYQPSWELRGGYDNIPKEDPLPEDMQRELIHGYYACVSHIDDQVGKLLNKLDELGLRENTVIVLWGDHGWHLGDHSMWCKHTNFEQSTRTPLIFSAPQVSGKKLSNSPTEFVDIFPTLCELAGINTPKDLDGKSLLPIMNNPTKQIKEYSVSQFKRKNGKQNLEGYTLRTDKYRYTVWVPRAIRDGADFEESKVIAAELYDYEKDPLEKVNHLNQLEYKDVQKQLQKYMKEYFAKRKSS